MGNGGSSSFFQVTTIADRALGLGYNPRKDKEQMRQVLEMIQAKKGMENIGVGEYQRLLPKVSPCLAAGAPVSQA